jgi:hypothetical protein
MSKTSSDASLPALVLVMPRPARSGFQSASDDAEFEEERDGNVFVGLKFAMILYALVALTIATGWQLYRLFS